MPDESCLVIPLDDASASWRVLRCSKPSRSIWISRDDLVKCLRDPDDESFNLFAPFDALIANPADCARYRLTAPITRQSYPMASPGDAEMMFVTPSMAIVVVALAYRDAPASRLRVPIAILVKSLRRLCLFVTTTTDRSERFLWDTINSGLSSFILIDGGEQSDTLITPCPHCKQSAYAFAQWECTAVTDTGICGQTVHVGAGSCSLVPTSTEDVILQVILNRQVVHCEQCRPKPVDMVSRIAMPELLLLMQGHDDAWIFNLPVNIEQYPEYSRVITSPMDLGTVLYRLKKGMISTLDEFESLVRQVFQNAFQFNEVNSAISKAAMSVLTCFEGGPRVTPPSSRFKPSVSLQASADHAFAQGAFNLKGRIPDPDFTTLYWYASELDQIVKTLKSLNSRIAGLESLYSVQVRSHTANSSSTIRQIEEISRNLVKIQDVMNRSPSGTRGITK